MNKEEFERYLQSRYEDQCQWYSAKAGSNKWRYLFFQTAILVLSGVTTLAVAAGIYFSGVSWIRLVALSSTTLVTVLAGLMKVYRFQEQWIEYRDTSETLKKEKHIYTAKLGDYATATSAEKLFVERVESLISRQNTRWISRGESDK